MSASTYSELYQLAALAFAHPSPELHACLCDGTFQRQFQARCGLVRLHAQVPPVVQGPYERYEADYIALFHHGVPGRESVSLFETDYLTSGASRGAHLAGLTRFFRACGLVLSRTEGSREQPDHLVCQLELMVYLTFRQAAGGPDSDSFQPCVEAQRDFLSHRLQRWVVPFARRTAQASVRIGADPFLPAMALALEALVTHHLGTVQTQRDSA